MAIRLLGVYIDTIGAPSLAGARVCLVEETDNGNVLLRALGKAEGIMAVVTEMETFELAEIVDAIYGPPDQRLVS
jgi:hypothetical protein